METKSHALKFVCPTPRKTTDQFILCQILTVLVLILKTNGREGIGITLHGLIGAENKGVTYYM